MRLHNETCANRNHLFSIPYFDKTSIFKATLYRFFYLKNRLNPSNLNYSFWAGNNPHWAHETDLQKMKEETNLGFGISGDFTIGH